VETGLSLRGDELLIKAREAMIAAVHTFNSAGLTFRTELFIVTAVIAWTYLLHARFKREGIGYRHSNSEKGQKVIAKTPNGAEKFWELSQCLKHSRCPVEQGAKDNLAFLIDLRHEIEHRSTSRIDDAVSAKLQACCINFNDAIKKLFGAQYGLERRLPIALQFVTFSPDQRALLKKAAGLPRNVETMMGDFERNLTPEQQADPRYAFRVFMIHKSANRAPKADLAVEIVPPGSEIADKFNIALKEVEKKKYLPSEIVDLMKAEGWSAFAMDSHTKLRQKLGGKDPAKGYGAIAVGKTWCWYEMWLTRVREECRKNPEKYRKAPVIPAVKEAAQVEVTHEIKRCRAPKGHQREPLSGNDEARNCTEVSIVGAGNLRDARDAQGGEVGMNSFPAKCQHGSSGEETLWPRAWPLGLGFSQKH